jgi:hypothetical protein
LSPGLVYLGVNGEEFLKWTEQLLDSYYGRKILKLRKPNENPNVSTDDLPMDGTVKTLLTTDHNGSSIELPIAGDASNVLMTFPKSSRAKPFWWYMGLFPFWCAIARTGQLNMNEKCGTASESEEVEGEMSKSPTCVDFLYAMVFIKFGIISAIAGVVSNIWLLLKK